jgi:type I restriction enzyme S subunit
MNLAKIGDVVTKAKTWDPRKDAPDNLIRYIDIGSVSQDTKVIGGLTPIMGSEAPSRARQLVQAGDILVSTVRPNLNAVARVPEELEGATASTGFSVLRPEPDHVYPAYLFHWVRTGEFVAEMMRQAIGQSYPAVSDKIVKASEIPLPPLEEQKRIAGILDQAAELCRLRAHALDTLNTLGQAIFHEMFGDVAQNPMGFRRGTIGELAAETQYGTSEKASETGPLPVLRMNNLTYDGRMDLASLKYMDLKASDFAKYTVVAGDMLFNRTNSPDLVGKTAVYRGQSPMAFAGYLVRLRANAEGNTDYISAVLNSAYGKATLRGMCKSIIGMANINAKELCKISLPIPPRQLQDAFSNRLAEVNKERPKFEAAIAESNTLFASLQHRAFRGEL